MYIAIAGNIGSGKSLLAELLAQRLGWQSRSLCDGDSENPYINDFYEDMEQWSFSLQVYFLGTRWQRLRELIASGKNTIIDRTIYEDAEVFAQNLRNNHLLGNRDFSSYCKLYNQVIEGVEPPLLLIYLRASNEKLLQNIKKRGRAYESAIDKHYLESLSDLYEDWTFSYDHSPIITIDIDTHDIDTDEVAREEVLEQIIRKIESLR